MRNEIIEEIKEKYYKRDLYEHWMEVNPEGKGINEILPNIPDHIVVRNHKMPVRDKRIFRKYAQMWNNAVESEFDGIQCLEGGEGGGKSTYASYLAGMLWWIGKELGLINKKAGTYYNFNLHNILCTDMDHYIEKFEAIRKPFRILIMDEGNSAKAINIQDKKLQKLNELVRTKRKKLCFSFMIHPVAQELFKGLLWGRVNSIVTCDVEPSEDGLDMIKKDAKWIILNRGSQCYSWESQQLYPKNLIKRELKKCNDDRYIRSFPEKYLYCISPRGRDTPFTQEEIEIYHEMTT